jgi:hypothetical protein
MTITKDTRQRPGDRHTTPRPGDRHNPRTGNRHRPGYISPNAEPPKAWKGRFVAFDGEGWDGKYMIFACSAMPYDLYDPEGISTSMCLRYMLDYRIKGWDACIGFGLSYDFENILADVPDADYKKLLDGEKIQFEHYTIKYIPRKILEVSRDTGHTTPKGRAIFKTIILQDILGFFQTSFEKALEKWEVETPEIIKIGKALRGDFNKQPVKFIKEYNREELKLMVELMDKLREADRDAFETIGLRANHSPRTWYGPGARASNFLRQTNWVDEHPEFIGDAIDHFRDEVLTYFPKGPDGELLKKLNRTKKTDLQNEINEVTAALKELVRGFQISFQIMEDDTPNIKKKVKALGGIAPSRWGAWAGEYRELPRNLKNKKNGRPLDELADELGLDVRTLLDYLQVTEGLSIEDKSLKAAEQTEDYYALLTTKQNLELELENLQPEVDPKELLEYENLKEHPFAAAFYGGRIESAAVGTFAQPSHDYDVNSAYPFAISNIPKWDAEDLREVEGMDRLDRMGIYRVEWNCPPGINFYPLPYRSKSGNVFYPPSGAGWYMSPEVSAALDIYGPECIKVKKGYVLKGTEGAGTGLVKLAPEKLCTTAKKMSLMAAERLIAKAEKKPKERVIKLVMNSGYGKTIQQIGSHKFLNLFAASWITSTCRAIIVRAIGADLDNSIVAIMTDGILSLKELPVKLGKLLGEFDQTDFDFVIQFMPGIYLMENSLTGNKVLKYRGMGKNFDAKKAVKILKKKVIHIKEKKINGIIQPEKKFGYYEIDLNIFVTRSLALHQPNKFGDKRYRFLTLVKKEEFSLKSKRAPGPKGFRLTPNEDHRFFPPKAASPLEVRFFGSKPYVLDLPAEQAYDEAETEEDLLSNARITSALEVMEYDLTEG